MAFKDIICMGWNFGQFRIKPMADDTPQAFTPCDHEALARDALNRFPGRSSDELVGIIMKENGGKCDPNALRVELRTRRAQQKD